MGLDIYPPSIVLGNPKNPEMIVNAAPIQSTRKIDRSVSH